jgi:hypothetical protein
MAVIQISKIQVRRGAIGEQGMPQLASGEMGWAVDTQQLFIGNGSVAEGAPAVGNTEVLTQYSTATINLFNCTYEYQGGFTATSQTGYFKPYTKTRPLQSKLDEYVSVLDFGADPSGTYPCDRAIQNAITATYMSSHFNPLDLTNPDLRFRKILHFPAGRYLISGTVYIPPYTSIQGEGADNTNLIAMNTAGRTTIFRTRSIYKPQGGGIDFLSTTSTSLPVTGVSISNITFQYSPSLPIYNTSDSRTALLNLDFATYSEVRGCKFQGNYTTLVTTVSNRYYAGINITGITTSNLEIDNNEFYGLITGVTSYEDTQYVTFSNNVYDTLYTGMFLGSTDATKTINGNLYGQALNNKFLNIFRTGFSVNISTATVDPIGFVSNGNLFSNVGNGTAQNEGGQQIECIAFNKAAGCVSLNDKFVRFDKAQTTYSTSTFKPLVNGQAIVINDIVARRYPIKWTNSSTLIRIPYLSTMTGITMEYQVQKTAGVRKGILTVLASPFTNGTVIYTDQYNYFGTRDPGVVFSAKLINSTNTNLTTSYDCIAIQYKNDSTEDTVTFRNTGTGVIDVTIKYQT